jgi:hypothetical protein
VASNKVGELLAKVGQFFCDFGNGTWVMVPVFKFYINFGVIFLIRVIVGFFGVGADAVAEADLDVTFESV